jgi:hypothetical protein
MDSFSLFFGNYIIIISLSWVLGRSFSETQQVLLGQRAVHLMHGAGYDGNAGLSTPRDYFATHNFGSFHPRTIQRSLPAMPSTCGMQVADMLNFFMSLMQSADNTSFKTASHRIIYPVICLMDGMMIAAGLQADEQNDLVWGFVSGPLTFADCEELVELNDDEVRRHGTAAV